jgi:hypothetical protein
LEVKLIENNNKIKCEECGWIGTQKEELRGVNPFDKSSPVFGCPKCFEINSTFSICDENGCEERANCGTPVEKGYRWTCGKHIPKRM